MAEDLVLDVRNAVGYHPDALPYIEWLRPVNEGLGEGQGEAIIRQKMQLFDSKGSPYVWVDPPTINFYLTKGWKIVSYGNFDFVGPNGQPNPQLQEIRGLVTGHFQAHVQITAQAAEIERQRAELEELRALKASLEADAAEKAKAEAEEKSKAKGK